MKSTIIFLLLLFPGYCIADNWTREDTQRELAFQVVALIDWGQTLDISRSCNTDRYFTEINPILGECPSRGDVNTYFPIVMGIHAGISYALPPKYRKYWQNVTFSIQATNVARNYSLGIKFDF